MTTPAIDVKKLCVSADTPLLSVLERQNAASAAGLPAGIALVINEAGTLLGTVTDGDVRRSLLRSASLDTPAGDAMNDNPVVFAQGQSFGEILASLPQTLEARGRSKHGFLGKIVIVDDERKPVRVLDYHQLWEQRVASHRHVVVLGMGYVGLTLALALAERGLRVTGVDTDPKKVSDLAAGRSHVHEHGLPELLREELKRNFSTAVEVPDDGDIFIIAVGTPIVLDEHGARVPDLGMIRSATRAVAAKMRRGALVTLRSTVPVGCCRSEVVPLLEAETNLIAGQDFHVSFAPERTVEGKALRELRSLPQVIGGINDDSVEATVALFRELTPTIVRVNALESAEFVKLINNSFRDLIFAFANEMSQIASAFGVDIHEVIGAANHGYPRDPVPLPSPGVGGPCLTKDPYILAYAAAAANKDAALSTSGRAVNESMHEFVATSIVDALNACDKDIGRARVVLCGLAFKGRPETGDLRNSSALEIAAHLASAGIKLYGHDPVASEDEIRACAIEPVAYPAGLENADAVVYLNNHRFYENTDVHAMVRACAERPIIYDGWHTFREQEVRSAKVGARYLTLGYHSPLTVARNDGGTQ